MFETIWALIKLKLAVSLVQTRTMLTPAESISKFDRPVQPARYAWIVFRALCAEQARRIFKKARAKRVKRVKRIEWNNVSLVVAEYNVSLVVARIYRHPQGPLASLAHRLLCLCCSPFSPISFVLL